MENNNYQRKIDILLENSLLTETPDLKNINSAFVSQNFAKIYSDIQDENLKWFLVQKQILAIKAMFEKASPNGRKEIVDCLISYYGKNDVLKSMVVTKVLANLGQTNSLLRITLYSFENYDQTNHEFYFKTLTFLFEYQSYLFTNSQINKAYDWLDDYFHGKNKTGKSMHESEILYRKYNKVLSVMKNQLNELVTGLIINDIFSDFNPEINLDEKKLIDEFSRYGFPQDLSETLDKIDTKISQARDGFDHKNCMDLMRSFTERLFASIAIEIDHIEGRKIDEKDSNQVAKFFVEKKLLKQSQADFLVSLRHFLSNTGSHKLKSAPEESRLSRNILIEFSLFLITRLKEIKNKD